MAVLRLYYFHKNTKYAIVDIVVQAGDPYMDYEEDS